MLQVGLLEITAEDTSMQMDVFSAEGLESVTDSNIMDTYLSHAGKIMGDADRPQRRGPPKAPKMGFSYWAVVCLRWAAAMPSAVGLVNPV